MRHRAGHDAYGGIYGATGAAASSSIGGGSFDGSVFKDKPRKRGSFVVPPFVKNPLLGLATTILFAVLTLNYRWQQQGILQTLEVSSAQQAKETMDKLRNDKREVDRQLSKAKAAEKQASIKIQGLEKQQKVLQAERDNLKKRAATGAPDPKIFEAREKEMLTILQRLQNATQKTSKDAVIEKFGNGPHRVEFSLTLPSDETGAVLKFIVEMAPLNITPHAQHFFLEQIHAGLWNSGWFYVNGPHVLQCGPQAPETMQDDKVDDRDVALKPFRDRGLESLLYPEYSKQYPHEKWTLGLTGRPGGPDWYINKQNNTLGHGLGSQSQYPLSDLYADPCFAKVVSGFDTLDRVFAQPTLQSGEYKHFFEEPVRIKEAKIISPIVPKVKQLPVGQQQLQPQAGAQQVLLQGAPQQTLSQQQTLQQTGVQQLLQGLQLKQGGQQQTLGQQSIVADPLQQALLLQQQQQSMINDPLQQALLLQQQQQQPMITDPLQQALLLQQQLQQQAIVTDPLQQALLLQQQQPIVTDALQQALLLQQQETLSLQANNTIEQLNATVTVQNVTATGSQNVSADQQNQSSSSSSFVEQQPAGKQQETSSASSSNASASTSKSGAKDAKKMKELMMARRPPLTVDP